MRAHSNLKRAALAVALTAVISAPVAAQLPSASPAAFAMGGNFTAIARGYEAIAWNPANLAAPGRPGFSLGLVSVAGNVGLDPVDLSALHAFSGRIVDNATVTEWVQRARVAGGQRGRVDAGVTPIALTVGPIGVQVGSTVYTTLNLSPDAWEALLVGNAGLTNGQPKTLDFTGTSLRTGAFTTGALSYGRGIPLKLSGGILRDEHASVGINAKYVVGHGLAVAEDVGSTLGSDLQLRFPVITMRTDSIFGAGIPQQDYNGVAGTGIGIDLAAAWSGGPWRLGMLAENVMNTFKWDTTKLAYMPGTGDFTVDSLSMNFDQQAFGAAPQALRDIVAAQRFPMAVTLGGAFQLTSRLTLTADMKQTFGSDEAIVIGPRSRYGVGAELRILPFIPLRAGVASVTGGWQAGAGLAVHLLGFEVGASTSIRQIGAARQSGVMIGVLGIGR